MAKKNQTTIKEKFELWILNHFGHHMRHSLKAFDNENGYQDEMLNAIWVGFNAGLLMA
tara:strand:- start:659 stop:832 length:174 start_codon:yes stop_codon:yes gene_type:complete